MKTYTQIQVSLEENIDKFPMFFAFTNEQFEKGKKELDVIDENELISIGANGFIKKSDKESYVLLFKNYRDELQNAMKNFDFCVNMFLSELIDHEYIVTNDLEETISACGLTFKEINESKHLHRALEKARTAYLHSYI